jgi:hypothetical protein
MRVEQSKVSEILFLLRAATHRDQATHHSRNTTFPLLSPAHTFELRMCSTQVSNTPANRGTHLLKPVLMLQSLLSTKVSEAKIVDAMRPLLRYSPGRDPSAAD